MSRIGKLPIQIPEGVEVKLQEKTVFVKGPKGELDYTYPDGVNVKMQENEINVTIQADQFKNLRGLARTLIANMIEGVTNGYEKKLQVIGVGYNAKVQGQKLVLNLGYSHPINYDIPTGITISQEKDSKGNDILTIQGIDKQLVGQTTYKIKSFRQPEVYKGKGVRYLGEHIKLKAGKTAKK